MFRFSSITYKTSLETINALRLKNCISLLLKFSFQMGNTPVCGGRFEHADMYRIIAAVKKLVVCDENGRRIVYISLFFIVEGRLWTNVYMLFVIRIPFCEVLIWNPFNMHVIDALVFRDSTTRHHYACSTDTTLLKQRSKTRFELTKDISMHLVLKRQVFQIACWIWTS